MRIKNFEYKVRESKNNLPSVKSSRWQSARVKRSFDKENTTVVNVRGRKKRRYGGTCVKFCRDSVVLLNVYSLSRSCLAVLLLWLLSLRWGWAGFLGGRGGVWIAPAATPASHLPSSGHLYRSWGSNQSSPHCRTTLVVIRPTPVFPLWVIPSTYLAFCLLSASFPLSTLRALVFSCQYWRPWLDSSHQPVPLTCLLALPHRRLRTFAPQPAPCPPEDSLWN